MLWFSSLPRLNETGFLETHSACRPGGGRRSGRRIGSYDNIQSVCQLKLIRSGVGVDRKTSLQCLIYYCTARSVARKLWCCATGLGSIRFRLIVIVRSVSLSVYNGPQKTNKTKCNEKLRCRKQRWFPPKSFNIIRISRFRKKYHLAGLFKQGRGLEYVHTFLYVRDLINYCLAPRRKAHQGSRFSGTGTFPKGKPPVRSWS